jgi:stage II sporulation protein AA (anti-sigma F factor antagonist)
VMPWRNVRDSHVIYEWRRAKRLDTARGQERGSAMDIRSERMGSTMILDIDGPLTVEADTQGLHEYVRSLTRRDASNLVLDLGHVRRLDSYGVGQLVMLYNELKSLGVPLTLVNVEPHQKRLLQVAGLLAVFPVFDSRREALTRCEYAAA